MATAEVEGIDDLLVIILVQLPARSIFRFRCVSTRWKNTISTPFFLRTYYNTRKARRRMLAYIQSTSYYLTMLPVPTSECHNIDTSVRYGLHFVNSSNGLILCSSRPPAPEDIIWAPPLEYHIINPFTKRCVSLPPNKVIKHPHMALMCEEDAGDLVLHYKVIGVRLDRKEWVMETFSSNTCVWTTSKQTNTSGCKEYLMPGYTIVVDGIIHWCTDYHVAVYNLNQAEHSVQMIQLPFEFHDDLKLARLSRDDPLWLCENEESCVRIWMLPNAEYSLAETEWVLMHNISYKPLFKAINSNNSSISYPEWWPNSYLLTLLAGLVPWESPLVALLVICCDWGLIYHCNLENMTFEQFQYPVHVKGSSCYSYYSYMEPLCLSSYTF